MRRIYTFFVLFFALFAASAQTVDYEILGFADKNKLVFSQNVNNAYRVVVGQVVCHYEKSFAGFRKFFRTFNVNVYVKEKQRNFYGFDENESVIHGRLGDFLAFVHKKRIYKNESPPNYFPDDNPRKKHSDEYEDVPR